MNDLDNPHVLSGGNELWVVLCLQLFFESIDPLLNSP